MLKPPPVSPDQFSVKILAEDLKLNTLQGIAIVQDSLIVPTIEGEILQVGRDGKRRVLANLLNNDLGVPFAIASLDERSVVVTTSTYDPLHFLLRVGLDGSVKVICDLSEFHTLLGAPFGVAIQGKDFILVGSKDVTTDQGVLYRVTGQGKIEEMVSLIEFGDPLGILIDGNRAIVPIHNGSLLSVQGKAVSELANLSELGLGVAFGLVFHQNSYLMSTNKRQIIQVNPENGLVKVLYDLMPKKVGIPGGMTIWNDRLIVLTDGGRLIEIQ